MKKNKLLIILLSILIIAILSISISIAYLNKKNQISNKENVVKYNENKTFIKTQQIDNLIISNINCYYDGQISLLSYSIKNTTNEEIYLGKYTINIKDKEDNIITNINVEYDYNLKETGEFYTSNSVGEDLSNASTLEFIKNEVG